MKFDAVFHGKLTQAAETARHLEQCGLHGMWSLDTGDNPFFPLLLAAEHTTRLELGTGVAVALARSPMTLAQEAWNLAGFSKGRFHLGLGSQIKPHITKRFSMPWDQPVEQMRDMIGALRAIWNAFQNGGKLQYEGKYYRHTLLTPFFTPAPIEHPHIPIGVAGVGPKMTELAGELADEFMMHPFTHRKYYEAVTLPALREGLRRGGRERSSVQVVAPIFLITGTEAQQLKMEVKVRAQIAFYGSTPAYRDVLDMLGHGALSDELHKLSRAGEWQQMARLIPQEVLDEFAIRASLAELPAKLLERYGPFYDRVLTQVELPEADFETIQKVVAALEGVGAKTA